METEKKMKKHKFKFSSSMLDEMDWKATGVTYDNEEKRSEELLAIISEKIKKIKPREKRYDVVNRITEKQQSAKSYKEYVSLELSKYKKEFAYLEITEEEFNTWYEYWLNYYYDHFSCYGDIRENFTQPFEWLHSHKVIRSVEYLEAEKLLTKMKKAFKNNSFNNDYRASNKLKFAYELAKANVTTETINQTMETKH
jgi:hypothetical protein